MDTRRKIAEVNCEIAAALSDLLLHLDVQRNATKLAKRAADKLQALKDELDKLQWDEQ